MRQRAVETRFESLEGDCLLGAAVMIYLAQFTQRVREKYLRKWRDQLEHSESLSVSPYFDFASLFGDQLVVKEWIINKLPSDPFSISNAIIIDQAPVQSIIIDP